RCTEAVLEIAPVRGDVVGERCRPGVFGVDEQETLQEQLECPVGREVDDEQGEYAEPADGRTYQSPDAFTMVESERLNQDRGQTRREDDLQGERREAEPDP